MKNILKILVVIISTVVLISCSDGKIFHWEIDLANEKCKDNKGMVGLSKLYKYGSEYIEVICKDGTAIYFKTKENAEKSN